MKKLSRAMTALILLTFVLAACGQAVKPVGQTADTTQAATAAANSEDVLYVNILWHQHQPLYYKDDAGYYTRPWVRVHATKDYYDMAATVAKYPNVHVTFNLTPVLIEQLNDYVNNGAKDEYWVLSEKPAASLTDEEKTFLLTRFFDANWDHMIRVHPGYKRLLDLRGGTSDAEIQKAMTTFSEQDFRDLQIWFNLAWMDPDELAKESLATLVAKDHDFSEEDKAVIFSEVRRIMAEVLPIHKELQEKGQIEVITTPLAHPILPLIYNSNEAAKSNPNAELPKQFSYVQDAIAQLNQSVEIYTETYGVAPRGLWPAEGAVSQDIVPLVGNAGFTWMASGEEELASSLGIGSFTRDSSDTVLEADQLYRPYFVQGRADGPIQGPEVMMVFRDTLLSDKLGFTYSQTPGKEAAADFMQRLENIRAELKAERATGPHLVSVILDGENAWENYDNDGKEFLNALYADLSASQTIKTVTPSEYLSMFPQQEKLDTLYSGAWFSANYDTWIGEPEETTAWNYLGKVRKFLQDYELGKKQAPSDQALKDAFNYMYFAEGSDWFWWYGSDQDSGNDAYFDQGFRSLLEKVYTSLDQPVPTFLKVPIIPEAAVDTSQKFSGVFTPQIDGAAGDQEWAKAAYYPTVGGVQARAEDIGAGVYFGVDAQNLYIRVDAKSNWASLTDGVIGIYLSAPKGSTSTNAITSLTQNADSPTLLGFSATNLLQVNLADLSTQFYSAAPASWIEGTSEAKAALQGTVLEVALPLSALGELQSGDNLDFRVELGTSQRDIQTLPEEGPAQLVLPDIGNVTPILQVTDPAGDDHGPGTYTYPTDTVFSAGDFDLTSFEVGMTDSDMVFSFTFAGQITNPWNSGNNLSLQTLDVYVDKDPGAGTGARILLPGRNAALPAGDGWDYALWAEGWQPGVFAPDPTTLQPKSVAGSSLKIIVDTANNKVTLRVPKSTFGEGDPTQWGYVGLVLSQDGYPSPGVWRVRDVQSQSAQWRIGGGSDTATNQTRILDLAWQETTPTQEEMLSAFTPSTADVDTLSADDFAQIQLLTVK
ncbi:MAG: glycoside hydrolase [Anaerolineaceae bacterium]|nr:glycoside hydrolase [Anaerolineaceae bacterium]